MTEKKENILKTALELFAKEGYNATSTSKVAKQAEVSEGLIFRHFTNKEGLLQAVLKEGETQVKNLYANILEERDPKEVIKKTLLLPFTVPESEHEYWKLQFKLKWELEHDHVDKMEPLRQALIRAFTDLNYKWATQEAEFIIHYLDGVSGAILKGSMNDMVPMKEFLLEKYNLK